jgi:hypothetical protein
MVKGKKKKEERKEKMILILCCIFMSINACTLKYSDIQIYNFVKNNTYNDKIKFIYPKKNESILKNDTCLFDGEEMIYIVLDDWVKYLDDLVKIVKTSNNNTLSESMEMYIIIYEYYKKKDTKKMKEICKHIVTHPSTFLSYIPYLEQACEMIYTNQNKPTMTYVVNTGSNVVLKNKNLKQRRGNFTSTSHTFNVIRAHNEREQNKKKYQNISIAITNVLIMGNNYISKGVSGTQSYLLTKLDTLTAYRGYEDREFNIVTYDAYYIAYAILRHPIKFSEFVRSSLPKINKLHDEFLEYRQSKLRGNYRYMYEWFAQFGKKIKEKAEKNKLDKRGWDEKIMEMYARFPDFWEVNDFTKYHYYNETCYMLNDTNGYQQGKQVLKWYNLVSVYHIPELWDYRLSPFKPFDKNATSSTFRVWASADYIQLFLVIVEWLRRSFYLQELFGIAGLQEDFKNCKAGWPLIPDPDFGCPITKFALLPDRYTEVEDALATSGFNFSLCKEWEGDITIEELSLGIFTNITAYIFNSMVKSSQGWIQYINAMFSPYWGFPTLIIFPLPAGILCMSPTLQEYFGWGYFKVNGTYPCSYSVYDLPPFVEECVLYAKPLPFVVLIIVVVLIWLILLLGCIRFCCKRQFMVRIYKRLNHLENEVTGSNYIFIGWEG